MKTCFTLLTLVIGSLHLSEAQVTQPNKFIRPYGTVQTDINQGYKIIPTQDGNFLIAGNWNNSGYLMKVNCKGDSLDRKTYASVVGGNYKITDVLELANGDFLVGGQCDHCVVGDTTGKVLLFETDASMNYKSAVGVKKFLPPVSGTLMTVGEATPDTKLEPATDGFYVLSITHCLSDVNPVFGCWNNEDSYLTKVNNALGIQWQKLLDFENAFVFHYENDPQIRGHAGNLYISRWGTNFFGTIPDSSVVQKTDLNGNPLISKTFNGRILSTVLNPSGSVLTCVGEIDTVAWLMNLNASTLNVLSSTMLTETSRTQASTVQYTIDGHLLVGTKHWRPTSVQSRIQRMLSDFTLVSVDTIPNPDNFTNMSITSVWPTDTTGTRLVSCGIRGLYNRTFFHALSDCVPFNLILANINPVTCNGFFNGSVTVTVSNGYGPFQYRKNNGNWQSSNILNGLGAGNYVISARDGNGNILSQQVTITQPQPLTLSSSISLNVITVTAGGGTAPYEYKLGINGVYQSSPVFDSLANGAYIITVQDANGCVMSTTALVNAPPLQASGFVSGQILCHGNAGGQITLNVSGGVPPYWLNNNPLHNGDVLSGLFAGNYTFVVSDSQGNTKTVTVTLNQPSQISVSAVANQSDIIVTASGGTGTLHYSLDGQNFQPGNIFTGVPDGVYTVTVKDANGCTATGSDVLVSTLPTAGFTTLSATTGCSPLTIQFIANTSQNTTSYFWEFNGGNPATSTDKNPVVIYNDPGMYDVTLIAGNIAGLDEVSVSNYITVLAQPVASFSGSVMDTTFTFANTSTNATSYFWNFGDGSTSTGENPVHTFSGSPCMARFITLIASNSCSADTAFMFTPQIDPLSPVAAFTFITADLTVTFTNTSQWAASQVWDFGDGSTSTEVNPMHTYASAGAYVVILTVEEFCGYISDDVTQTVTLATGIHTADGLRQITLYPNPNDGNFMLELSENKIEGAVELSLFSSTGQLIRQELTDFSHDSKRLALQYSDLPPAMYVLRIRAGDKTAYLKVFVQR